MTVDLDRLVATPQPLLHAAVQQALGQPDFSSDLFLNNVDNLLRSSNEVRFMLNARLHACAGRVCLLNVPFRRAGPCLDSCLSSAHNCHSHVPE